MITFYGYNDGQAIAIRNRRIYLRIASYSLVLVIPLTVIGIVRAEFLWFISWAFPLFFVCLSLFGFLFIKYDNEVFLKGTKTKHVFKVENARIYKDGREIKQVDKIRVYRRKNYLFLETAESFFRIPDDGYTTGCRTELLQMLNIQKNHAASLRLPSKTAEEKKEILLGEIDLKNKCRLFYSENKERVVYIYRRKDGFFSVGADRLVLADEEEEELWTTYGWWEPDYDGTSIFETEEMAYNEIRNLVSDYTELKWQ